MENNSYKVNNPETNYIDNEIIIKPDADENRSLPNNSISNKNNNEPSRVDKYLQNGPNNQNQGNSSNPVNSDNYNQNKENQVQSGNPLESNMIYDSYYYDSNMNSNYNRMNSNNDSYGNSNNNAWSNRNPLMNQHLNPQMNPQMNSKMNTQMNMINPHHMSYMMGMPQVPDLNSTNLFMNNIDVSCDDHKKTGGNINIQATRFCSKCKILCCDSCVIDIHGDHLKFANTKLDEYIKKQKRELESLRDQNSLNIEHKKFLSDVEDKKNKKIAEVEKYFMKRTEIYNTIKNSLNDLVNEEIEIKKKLVDSLDVFYKDECYSKIDSYIKSLSRSKQTKYIIKLLLINYNIIYYYL